MESTIRIGYNGSPSTPIIKIIAPKQITEDADPKDELVRDFLSTASVTDKHQLFYLQNQFPLESPFHVSIIAPMSYFDEPEMLRKFIERRVLPFEDICECREYETKIVPEMNDQAKRENPAPARYGTYLKLKDFFEWVGAQPYVEKPR